MMAHPRPWCSVRTLGEESLAFFRESYLLRGVSQTGCVRLRDMVNYQAGSEPGDDLKPGDREQSVSYRQIKG